MSARSLILSPWIPVGMLALGNAIAVYLILFGNLGLTSILQLWPVALGDLGSIGAVIYFERIVPHDT